MLTGKGFVPFFILALMLMAPFGDLWAGGKSAPPTFAIPLVVTFPASVEVGGEKRVTSHLTVSAKKLAELETFIAQFKKAPGFTIGIPVHIGGWKEIYMLTRPQAQALKAWVKQQGVGYTRQLHPLLHFKTSGDRPAAIVYPVETSGN